MSLRKNIRTLGRLNTIGGNETIIWGSLSVLTSLLAFFSELLFAIFLKRFFSSVGLVDGSSEIDFFGPIGDIRQESLGFILFGIIRSLILWINRISAGISQVAFESASRKKILNFTTCC